MENLEFFQSIYSEEVFSIVPPVTLVVGEPWNQLPEDQKQLLSKILNAVKQSLDSVKVLQQTQFDLSKWKEKPSRVIAFIAPPKGLVHYEVIQTGETAIVFSDPLAQLMADDAGKRKLWNALKGLFQA